MKIFKLSSKYFNRTKGFRSTHNTENVLMYMELTGNVEISLYDLTLVFLRLNISTYKLCYPKRHK